MNFYESDDDGTEEQRGIYKEEIEKITHICDARQLEWKVDLLLSGGQAVHNDGCGLRRCL